ncbi:hypothetical protein ACFXTH_021633 [Malus domestica]
MSFNLSSAIKLLASSNCPERDRRATSQARCNCRCLDADEVKLPFLNHVCSNASMKDGGVCDFIDLYARVLRVAEQIYSDLSLSV